jgi:hypothetical protein
VGALLVVLIAVLVARHAVDAAQVLPVSSGKEFLDALSGVATSGEDIVLEFQTDIFLSPALAATSYTLPFTVPSGRSISLQGPAAGAVPWLGLATGSVAGLAAACSFLPAFT